MPIDDEERALLESALVPDEEKMEIADCLEAWREIDLENAAEDEPLPQSTKRP